MTGIERLRGLACDMYENYLWAEIRSGREPKYGAAKGDGKTVNGLLRAIADQIEAEQEERVTRRLEDREAAEWVREHGGLDSVKKLLDWVVGHCSTKQQLDFDFWLSGRVMYELGFDDDMADRDEVERRLLARLMPEGMEWLLEAWPRFEDNSPVRLLDDFERCGDENSVSVVTMYSDGSFALNYRAYSKGERVNRPAPKVLDAGGVEIREGDTVYLLPGDWCDKWPLHRCHEWDEMEVTRISPGHESSRIECKTLAKAVMCYPYPSQLTHERPVLDADGNRIEPAMDVWWICEGDERGVHAEKLHVESIGEDGLVTCDPFNGGTWVELEPSELYVNRPVLDADGVLCREGDEVWEVRSHRRREIVGTHYRDYETGEPLILCDGDDAIPIPATCVTHTKPEPLDSWERLEEDAEEDPCGYFGFDGEEPCGRCPSSGKGCEQTMARDLVRRARALAERGE